MPCPACGRNCPLTAWDEGGKCVVCTAAGKCWHCSVCVDKLCEEKQGG